MYADRQINPLDIKINDQILIKREHNKKLERIYDGPYTVKEIDDKNVVVNIDNKREEIHKNRLVKAGLE